MLHVESADVGQHKVEHDDVGRLEIELSQRMEPIRSLTDEISRKGQNGPEGGAQVMVVLDDEDCPALEGLNVRHNRYIQAIFSLSPEPSIASLNPAGLKMPFGALGGGISTKPMKKACRGLAGVR